MNYGARIPAAVKTYLEQAHKVAVEIGGNEDLSGEFGVHVDMQVAEALGVQDGEVINIGEDYIAYRAELTIGVYHTQDDARDAQIAADYPIYSGVMDAMESRVRCGMLTTFVVLLNSYLAPDYAVRSPYPRLIGESAQTGQREGEVPIDYTELRYEIVFEINRQALRQARADYSA